MNQNPNMNPNQSPYGFQPGYGPPQQQGGKDNLGPMNLGGTPTNLGNMGAFHAFGNPQQQQRDVPNPMNQMFSGYRSDQGPGGYPDQSSPSNANNNYVNNQLQFGAQSPATSAVPMGYPAWSPMNWGFPNMGQQNNFGGPPQQRGPSYGNNNFGGPQQGGRPGSKGGGQFGDRNSGGFNGQGKGSFQQRGPSQTGFTPQNNFGQTFQPQQNFQPQNSFGFQQFQGGFDKSKGGFGGGKGFGGGDSKGFGGNKGYGGDSKGTKGFAGDGGKGKGGKKGKGKGKGMEADAPLPENCSKLLREFRTQNRKCELFEIIPHCIEFSKDQYGSRLIQSKLESCTPEEKHLVYTAIKKECNALILDAFANYVIQKLFEHGNLNQRRGLAAELSGKVLELSYHMYGCWVVQRAIEFLEGPGLNEQLQIVSEIKATENVLKLVDDQNGNHVIQKCIEKMPNEHIQFILEAFKGQVKKMSRHTYGCRVIQRLIEHCLVGQLEELLGEIVDEVEDLAKDEYGNYVIQTMAERSDTPHRERVIDIMCEKILELSCNKYASNCAEKALVYSNGEQRKRVIGAILGEPGDENPPLLVMMRDRYANYIVQRTIELAEGEQKDLLYSKLKDQVPSLRRFTYGKHIINSMAKIGVPIPTDNNDGKGGKGQQGKGQGKGGQNMNFSMMTNTTADSSNTQQQGGAGSFEPQAQAPIEPSQGQPSSNPFEQQNQQQQQQMPGGVMQ